VKLTFSGFLSYQSSCDCGEPILCYNKPRFDFDFKQRPSLAYYNKGSARFIITKANKGVFCIRYFSKTKSNPAKKNFRAILLRRNEAHMPKFRTFHHDFFFHPNRHLAPLQLCPKGLFSITCLKGLRTDLCEYE